MSATFGEYVTTAAALAFACALLLLSRAIDYIKSKRDESKS